MKVEIAARCGNELGESVLWDPERDEVLWVDIERGSILRLEPQSGAWQSSQRDDRIGAIGLREGGGLVLGLASGFALLNSIDGSLERLQTVESDLPTTRLNDGRVDRSGRFICGGMDEGANRQPISAVYRLDPDQQVHRIIDAVHISNSICFSPDGTKMYFTDMPSAQILVYSYDTDLGVPHDPNVFADLSDQPGLADGSTIDADGCLWNAQWGGSRIVRYAPSGAIDRVIELPVTNPTCPAFGGSDLRTLFITTATSGLSEAQRRPNQTPVLYFAPRPALSACRNHASSASVLASTPASLARSTSCEAEKRSPVLYFRGVPLGFLANGLPHGAVACQCSPQPWVAGYRR